MLRIIFWTLILVLLLSFFGISLQGVIESPTTQANLEFIWELVKEGWNTLVQWAHDAVNTVIA